MTNSRINSESISRMVTQTLKGSIEIQQMSKKIVELETKLANTYRHLTKFLDEFEGQWASDEKCESLDFALDYINAAEFAADNFGRKENNVRAVQEWYDNYLPY